MRGDRLLILLTVVAASGCQQKMADQPSYKPLVPARWNSEGMSARPLPPGVVAREWTRSDDPSRNSLKPEFRDAPPPSDDPATQEVAPPPGVPIDPSRFVGTFPFPVTRADLERGQERFTIYCTPCHDPIGNGRGKIVERGYVKPPNFHTDASRGFALYGRKIPLREVPVGYIFQVITVGYGAMPRYGTQIGERDRWRIIAYVRALQLSRHAVIADLPDGPRRAARAALGSQP